MNKKSLEELREYLNKLVNVDDICLHDGEVLDISKKLDELLNKYNSAKTLEC